MRLMTNEACRAAKSGVGKIVHNFPPLLTATFIKASGNRYYIITVREERLIYHKIVYYTKLYFSTLTAHLFQLLSAEVLNGFRCSFVLVLWRIWLFRICHM